MNEEQLREWARQAIEAGADPTAVQQRLDSLLAEIAPPESEPSEMSDAERRLSGSGVSPWMGGVSDFLRMMGQGASFGFGDELAGVGAALVPGGRNYTEARDASRQRVSDLRETSPVASFLSELSGGVVMPAAGAMQATTLPGRMALGGVAGGIGSGLYAMGEGEGSVRERMAGAGEEAATGAVLGAAVPAIGSGLRRMGGAMRRGLTGASPNRVAAGVREIVDDVPVDVAYQQADDAVSRVSREVYQPLEAKYPVVDHPAVREVLSTDDVRPHLRRVAPEVADGTRAPSFTELQDVRTRLRRARVSANRRDLVNEAQDIQGVLDDLDAAYQQAVPELAPADAAYRQANQIGDALADGRRNWNKNPGDIRRALGEYADNPEAVAAFRRGQITEVLHRLDRRADPDAVYLLKDLMDPGKGPNNARAILRTAFPDEQSYNRFVEILQRENSASVIHDAYKLLAKGLGFGAAAGAGYGAYEMLR